MTRNTLILAAAVAALTATGAVDAKPDHNNRHARAYQHNTHKSQQKARQSQARAYQQGYQDGRRVNSRNNARRVYVAPPRNYAPGQYYNQAPRYAYTSQQANYASPYWWGSNGRVHCRRKDGTTGLIVGAVAGGTLGNVIANHGDKTLGTVIGGALGGLLGREIDRGGVNCR